MPPQAWPGSDRIYAVSLSATFPSQRPTCIMDFQLTTNLSRPCNIIQAIRGAPRAVLLWEAGRPITAFVDQAREV